MRCVFALGGNAFGEESLRIAAKAIASLRSAGGEIVVTHGNGPQVGRLYLKEGKTLGLLTGETERELGSRIAKAITSEARGIKVSVVTTRVVVHKNDPEFRNPTKPIGRFYRDKRAVPTGLRHFEVRRLGRGYRLVVPSPRPVRIIEAGKIESLLSGGRVVIAAGGGGIAVGRSGRGLVPVDAVIDKDFASSLLAVKIRAERLFILTDVGFAYTRFGKKDQKPIRRVSVRQAERYLRQGSFEKGSMEPKILACIEFVRRSGGIAAIGCISKPEEVVSLRSTVILP